MLLLFARLSLSFFRAPPEINLYDMLDGNWSRRVNNVTTYYPVTIVSSVIENGANLTTAEVEYEGTRLEVVVTSNLTAKVSFGDRTGDITMLPEDRGVSYGECQLSDGTHFTVAMFANRAIELAVIPKGSAEVLTFGFHKGIDNSYSWKDFVIPTVLALVLTYLIRNVLPNFF